MSEFGRDDRLAQIEERLIGLAARSDADNVVLQVIVGQLAADRPDWRDYLDMLRMIAEAGLRNTIYHTGQFEAEQLRQLGLNHIEATFEAVRKALLAVEDPGDG